MRCIEQNDQCEGAVELAESMTGTGRPVARCDFHYERRLDQMQERRRLGFESDFEPAWFDPADAGECWEGC